MNKIISKKLTDNLIKLSKLSDENVVLWAGISYKYILTNPNKGNMLLGYQIGFYCCNIQYTCRLIRNIKSYKLSDDDKNLILGMINIENDNKANTEFYDVFDFSWNVFNQFHPSYKDIIDGLKQNYNSNV